MFNNFIGSNSSWNHTFLHVCCWWIIHIRHLMKQLKPRDVDRSFFFTSRYACYSSPRSPVRQKNQSLHGAAAHLSLALTEAWVNKGTASPLPLLGLPAKPVLGTAILWPASMIDGMWGEALEPDWAMRWHGHSLLPPLLLSQSGASDCKMASTLIQHHQWIKPLKIKVVSDVWCCFCNTGGLMLTADLWVQSSPSQQYIHLSTARMPLYCVYFFPLHISGVCNLAASSGENVRDNLSLSLSLCKSTS